MKATKKIKIDVFSDIACPWCYVGETNLKIAREQYSQQNPGVEFDVRFHAYMIDPGTKKEGEDYLAYNVRRWGSDGWTGSLRRAGKQIGCNFGNWKIWPNTFLAHCLVAEGTKNGKGEEVLDAIFDACYEKGQNVSLEPTLNKIAEKFGLSNWNSKENQKSVISDDELGKETYDIHGVPYFILDEKLIVESAQSAAVFCKAFDKCLKH